MLIKQLRTIPEIEVIEVKGCSEVLIRPRRLPEFAFLVKTTKGGTKWQISFNLPDGSSTDIYPIKCLCRSCGLDQLAQEEIKKTAMEKGIRIVFVRECSYSSYDIEEWDDSGIVFKFVEAWDHVKWMEKIYILKDIYKGTKFINYKKGRLGSIPYNRIIYEKIKVLKSKLIK